MATLITIVALALSSTVMTEDGITAGTMMMATA
jgi:hypothetical protein